MLDALFQAKTPQMVESFQHPSLATLREAIDKVIAPEAAYSKNRTAFHTQLCFAVKSGVNGLLDVARKVLPLHPPSGV
jgi:hypothetical protein